MRISNIRTNAKIRINSNYSQHQKFELMPTYKFELMQRPQQNRRISALQVWWLIGFIHHKISISYQMSNLVLEVVYWCTVVVEVAINTFVFVEHRIECHLISLALKHIYTPTY